jgi:phosphoglycolate phosphatase
MLNKYKHIIWDWNGTILNDVELCHDIFNGLLRKRALSLITLEQYREIFTFPVQAYYAKAGLDFNKYPFEELGKEWMSEYERRKNECKLAPGVINIIEYFYNQTKAQSILSAYPYDSLINIISLFGLNKYFEHIVGLDHIYATGKLELGRSLLKKIENGKDNILFIGDTVHDFEVAKEIGADCILVASGHQSKSKLSETNALVVNGFDDLLEIFRLA